MVLKVEKGDFVKISVSCRRNTHFARSGACFGRSKSIKKRFGKQNDSLKACLMDFDSIFGSNNASKIDAKIERNKQTKIERKKQYGSVTPGWHGGMRDPGGKTVKEGLVM